MKDDLMLLAMSLVAFLAGIAGFVALLMLTVIPWALGLAYMGGFL